MARAIFETTFDACYLAGAIAAGIWMVVRGGSPLVRKFGWMAVLLGAGDAFHLAPRVWALWAGGIEANAAALGIGKLVTSITMTFFYLILYYVWRGRYAVRGRRGLTAAMWALTIARVALCLLPQNDWLGARPPLSYGILRNVPFAVMGAMIVGLFAREVRRAGDRVFRHMPLAIALSFGFYIPVVLLGAAVPAVGMLMIPKTLAYVWVLRMGWKLPGGAA